MPNGQLPGKQSSEQIMNYFTLLMTLENQNVTTDCPKD